MTLDKTWENCLAMWKWIAENYDGTVHPMTMKRQWLRQNRFTKERLFNCFFCEYGKTKDEFLNCSKCPAFGTHKKPGGCENYGSYNWHSKPKQFYAKLVKLNEIRLKEKRNGDS